MKKNEKCFLLLNPDGLELAASRKTARDMALALKHKSALKILKLKSNNWIKQINELAEKESNNFFCLLATHGGFGENGELQRLLEAIKIPHSHSSAAACSVLANKHKTKLLYQRLGISTPSWIFRGSFFPGNFKSKFFVKKPIYGGSKNGLVLFEGKPPRNDSKNIYENLVPGTLEICIGVLGNGHGSIAFSPIVRKRSIRKISEVNNTKAKVDKAFVRQCQQWAKKIHTSLDCRGITKTDFLLDGSKKIWAIETDAIPGLSRENAVVLAADKRGLSYGQLISKIISDLYVQ